MKKNYIWLAIVLLAFGLLLGACSALPIARVHGEQTTFLPPSVKTVLVFDSVDFDSSLMFNGVSRFTVAQDNICVISARSQFMIMGNDEFAELTIRVNGDFPIAGDNIYTHTNSSPLLNTSTIYYFNADDYVEVIAFHDSQNILRATSTSFSIDCR